MMSLLECCVWTGVEVAVEDGEEGPPHFPRCKDLSCCFLGARVGVTWVRFLALAGFCI